jgi:hypothetical protein
MESRATNSPKIIVEVTGSHGASVKNNDVIVGEVSTLKGETSSHPTVYVLVSIMSTQYQTLDLLKDLMRKIHEKHGDSDVPIAYLCGDNVYNITKPFLFKNTGRDPVAKGRQKWIENHHQSVKELQAEGFLINQEIIFWDTIKDYANYISIKKFTDVVLDCSGYDLCLMSELGTNAPKVNKLYLVIEKGYIKYRTSLTPDGDSIELGGDISQQDGELYRAIQEGNFPGLSKLCKHQLLDITSKRGHTHYNLTLEKLHETFPGVSDYYLKSLIQDIQSLKILKIIPTIAEEFKSKNLFRLEKKTKKAEKDLIEFRDKLHRTGVALEKAHVDESNSELHKCQDNLRLATHDYLSEEFSVFLELALLKREISYPISTTKGSDVIFAAFRLVEALYLKYCSFLSLPILEQPAVIFDPFNIEIPYLPYGHVSPFLEPHVMEENSSSASTRSSSSSLPFFAEGKVKAQEQTDSDHEENDNDIALKIIKKIDAHLQLKLKGTITTKTLYKNGVTCEIKSSTELSADDQITDVADIKILIELAVFNVRKKINEEDGAIFNYEGHHFDLVIKPTVPRLALVRTPSPT